MANETYKFSLNAEDIDKKLNMIPDSWGRVSDQEFNPQSENPQSGKAVAEAVKDKVDKVDGKQLSTNDFTNEDKDKLDNVVGKKTAEGGEVFNDYKHNTASGLRSSVRNYGNEASGNEATAGGHHTVASGWASDSNGRDTEASGDQATSRGRKTVAKGKQSTSEGWETRALGTASKAQGIRTIAQANNGAFAHGGYGGAYNYQTESGGYGCLAVGGNSSAKGHSTLALGYTTNTHGRETIAGMSGWGIKYIKRGSEPNTLELYLFDKQPNNEIAPEDCLKPGTVDNNGEQFYDISAFDGKKSVDSFYEGIENGTITELPVLFSKGESILIKGCSVLRDNQTSAKYLLVELADIDDISKIFLKADNTTWSELPTETNLLKTATLENIGIVDGEETALRYDSGIKSIIDGSLSVRAQWQLPENSNSNSNKKTYIQSTFSLKDFANLDELRLDWTDGWACRWYEIFASDKEEDLYGKSLYEYNREVDNLEQIFNLYLNNVKYIGIRFYDLRKKDGKYGATVLPAEFTLTERITGTFGIDDPWLGNTLTHGYPLRPCVGANTNGYKTEARGQGSNANGVGTKAISKGQTALGTYNEVNPEAVAIFGNGTDEDHRSNAFVVNKDGTADVYNCNLSNPYSVLNANLLQTRSYLDNGDYLMTPEFEVDSSFKYRKFFEIKFKLSETEFTQLFIKNGDTFVGVEQTIVSSADPWIIYTQSGTMYFDCADYGDSFQIAQARFNCIQKSVNAAEDTSDISNYQFKAIEHSWFSGDETDLFYYGGISNITAI